MKSINAYLNKLFNSKFWFAWFAVGLWAWIFELNKLFPFIAIVGVVPAIFILHELRKELLEKLKNGK